MEEEGEQTFQKTKRMEEDVTVQLNTFLFPTGGVTFDILFSKTRQTTKLNDHMNELCSFALNSS